jgi:hypothetical protein
MPESMRLACENDQLLLESTRLACENDELVPESTRLACENDELVPESTRLACENDELRFVGRANLPTFQSPWAIAERCLMRVEKRLSSTTSRRGQLA